jgi:hypothetical protein
VGNRLEHQSCLTLSTTIFERQDKVSAPPVRFNTTTRAFISEGKIDQLKAGVYQPRLLTTARALRIVRQGRKALVTKRQNACAHKDYEPKKRFF